MIASQMERRFGKPVTLTEAVIQPFEQKAVNLPARMELRSVRVLSGEGFCVERGKMAEVGG